MSYSIDVNILLYASDSTAHQHGKARAFLSSRANDPGILCMSWLTIMSYMRIVTHSGIFASPLTPQAAWQNVENLLQLPRVYLIHERENFPTDYLGETQGMSVRGNLVPVAHLAVILWQNGVKQFYTNDSDFRNFGFLELIDPLV